MQAYESLAGNHLKFDSFAWHDRPEDPENWAIVYTHNRDSDLVDQSNAAAIAEIMEPYQDGDDPDVIAECHGHWAVGWVEGYAIRVYRDGEPTEAINKWLELQEQLQDYPLLDEEDHSRREYEAAIEAIRQEAGSLVRDEPPEDWAEEVFSWLWEHDQGELENHDGQGAYPSREAIRAALLDLDLLDAVYEVHVGDHLVLETHSGRSARKEFDTQSYHASMGIGAAALGLAAGRVTLSCDDEIIEEYADDLYATAD